MEQGPLEWVEAGSWAMPESCGCYIDDPKNAGELKVYFNREKSSGCTPDAGEIQLCKYAKSAMEYTPPGSNLDIPALPPMFGDPEFPEGEAMMVPPETEPTKQERMDKCVLGKPDCGLLNDNMAMMWGDIKDSVDELEWIMSE